MLAGNSLSSSIGGGSLVSSKHEELDARVDMTAMIDLVFMLNIFFMVTSLASAMAELDLPFATHVSAADMDDSLLISVIAKGKGDRPQVHIQDTDAEGKPVDVLVPDSQLDEYIAAAVQKSLAKGKKSVVVKAEANCTAGTDARIAAAVGAATDQMQLFFAVMEKD